MGNNVTMSAKDTLFAALAECFVTIGKRRYNFMQAINVEAKFEKTKTEVPILGKTGKGNKATGWKGTGSLTAHYNTSIFRKMMLDYKNTGENKIYPVASGYMTTLVHHDHITVKPIIFGTHHHRMSATEWRHCIVRCDKNTRKTTTDAFSAPDYSPNSKPYCHGLNHEYQHTCKP